jgi:hypothetical protein
MGRRQPDDLGERAVSLLATSFVVLTGAVTCFFIVVAFGEKPETSVGAWVGCFIVIAAMLWLLREKPARTVTQKYFWFCRPMRRKIPFRLEARRTAREAKKQPLHPPTLESIREQADGLHTWVPSELPPQRGPRHQ